MTLNQLSKLFLIYNSFNPTKTTKWTRYIALQLHRRCGESPVSFASVQFCNCSRYTHRMQAVPLVQNLRAHECQANPRNPGLEVQNRTQKVKLWRLSYALHRWGYLVSYDDSTDCRASCCCGCKEDHVEANTEGGNVAWSCLSRLIILLAVCSVARSLPAHNICIPYKKADYVK